MPTFFITLFERPKRVEKAAGLVLKPSLGLTLNQKIIPHSARRCEDCMSITVYYWIFEWRRVYMVMVESFCMLYTSEPLTLPSEALAQEVFI